MAKSIKVALIALAVGTLMAGVGAGIAFVEYSSLQYKPLEVENEGEDLFKSTSIEIGTVGDVRISTPYDKDCEIVPDENVPQGTMSIAARASSLADEIVVYGPHAWSTSNPQSQSEEKTVTDVSVYPMAYDNGTSRLLQYKDEILQGLKDDIVYELPSIHDGFSVEIRANPADIARLSF